MKQFVLTLLLLVIGLQSSGQDSNSVEKTQKKADLGLLFADEKPLAFTILSNLKPLLKDRSEKPVNHWGEIRFVDESKDSFAIPIKIKVRGNFRRLSKNCLFPPLLLDFDKKKKKNGIFNYQNKLKLITHCINEDYIKQEYLVYKMYNLLTDYSFKAKLATVTYQDSAAKRETETKLAFLLEDESDLAKRNGAKSQDTKQLRPNQLDTLAMATVSVFEYLIGNTDWSVPFLHNIKLFNKTGRYLIAVPYDFDHAGIVETNYAQPAEALELSSVRERLYRGISYPAAIFEQVFEIGRAHV